MITNIFQIAASNAPVSEPIKYLSRKENKKSKIIRIRIRIIFYILPGINPIR
jgi:hypothetical protein